MSLKLDGKKLSLEIEERLNHYISSNKKIAKRAPTIIPNPQDCNAR